MGDFNKKTALGVRGRLLLAFLGISMFSLVAAALGLYSLSRVRGALEVITDQQVPETLSLLELSRKVESVVRAAPALLVVNSDNSRKAVSEEIFLQIGELRPLLQASRMDEADKESNTLITVQAQVSNLTENLTNLNELVRKRLQISSR